MKYILVPIMVASTLLLMACEDLGRVLYSPSDEPKYITALVERNDLRDIIPASGVVQSAESVNIGSEIGGRITLVLVDFNDHVKSGELLAVIDPKPYKAALERAEAELLIATANKQEATAKYKSAERMFRNKESLVASGVATEDSLAQLEYDLAIAEAFTNRTQAAYKVATANVKTAKQNLALTEIRSPYDGIIIDRKITRGEVINATQETPVLFIVATDTNRFTVEAMVAENDIGRIREDLQVRITVDTDIVIPNTGTIEKIVQSPRKRGRFISYPVLVTMENPKGRILPGMTASVEFVHNDVRSAKLVPLAATYYRPEGYEPELNEDQREKFSAFAKNASSESAKGFKRGMELGWLIKNKKRMIYTIENGQIVAHAVSVGAQNTEAIEILDDSVPIGATVILKEIFDE